MVWEIVDPMHAEKNFTGRKVRKVEDRWIFLELFLELSRGVPVNIPKSWIQDFVVLKSRNQKSWIQDKREHKIVAFQNLEFRILAFQNIEFRTSEFQNLGIVQFRIKNYRWI